MSDLPKEPRGRVLIVDDTPANLAVLLDELEHGGFKVAVAQDGEEALERAEYVQPALILLDVMMPGIGGFETCRRLKAHPGTCDIPVIFMTALTDASDKVHGFACGGVDYVTKPFQMDEVMARIKTHLALRAAQRLVIEHNDALRREAQERRSAQLQLQETHERLLDSEERYRILVEMSPDAILVESDGQIVFANSAAAVLYGANRPDELLGRTLQSFAASPYRETIPAALGALSEGADARTAEEEALRLDGTRVVVSVTRVAVTFDARPAVQMVARDISARRRLEMRLQHQATHDTLTGLPNRALLLDRLNQAIAGAKRRDGRLLVCFLDLDRFKWVNDSLGHDAGDVLLCTVADRILACLRESDTVARLGGDEFVLLLPDATDAVDATTVARRVAASIAQPIRLGEHSVSVTCSVGCSHFPEDGSSADGLLKFADAAMYSAKAAGPDNLRVYNAELRRNIDERVRLESELRRGLERG